jgi:hypothetical protein
MKTLIIKTNTMEDLMKIVETIRFAIGKEIRSIEIIEQELLFSGSEQ